MFSRLGCDLWRIFPPLPILSVFFCGPFGVITCFRRKFAPQIFISGFFSCLVISNSWSWGLFFSFFLRFGGPRFCQQVLSFFCHWLSVCFQCRLLYVDGIFTWSRTPRAVLGGAFLIHLLASSCSTKLYCLWAPASFYPLVPVCFTGPHLCPVEFLIASIFILYFSFFLLGERPLSSRFDLSNLAFNFFIACTSSRLTGGRDFFSTPSLFPCAPRLSWVGLGPVSRPARVQPPSSS